ncbi:hypothetical protein MBSD_n2716 [Mizugakiibacter sediminis]|uniref:DUF4124 domain-containing protein n=1 Tax=Mizugakiibacter sediminis TaxID=1475481 RepID=A0A0K8QR41_9GAMM|nr:DUF4124 domain-containing protein [Mizugakiibacter sediminis]GAP67393.1 hypothetical protein MBSD_n2716 [Mizugakiibacter sediminis]
MLLAVAATAAGGDYYKWTDASGTVHYTQRPPQGRPSQRVSVDAGSGIAPPPEATRPADQGRSLREADARYREQACATARENLRLLESGQRMIVSGGVDEGTKLSAEQRAKALADARARIAETCDKP